MTARVNNNMIEATVNGHQLVITEEVVRVALQLGALDFGEVCYVAQIHERALLSFGYSGNLPTRQVYKGMLLEKWRFFYHVIMQCFAQRKSRENGMAHNLLSTMIGLTFNQWYSFARVVFQALEAYIGYEEGDSRLMMLYPRFLTIVFRHLVPDLPIHEGLAPHVLKATGRRIFSDCRNAKAPVHSPRLPELRPMLGIFGAGEDEDEDGAAPVVLQQPAVVQPQVDLQQSSVVIEEPLVPEHAVAEPVVVEHVAEPVAEPVNEPLHDVETEEVIHNIYFDQPDPNLDDIIFFIEH
ncbi:hypothetical protein Hdeb2414_s0008g00285411 [Helianthus debilis subsp. tardiflorus]